MKKIILILLSLCVFSCKSNNSVESLRPIEFYNQISKDWIFANYISDINVNGEITRPAGVDLPLFQINFLDGGSKKYLSHCVYYKVPFKKIIGELFVTENRELFKCSETPSAQVLFKLSHVSKLEISYASFFLDMKFMIGKTPYDFKIPLMNLKGPSIHKRFKNENETRLKNGMSFVRVDRESKFLPNNTYLGIIEDRFSKNTAIQCFHIDKNCNPIGEDFCEKCRYGNFEVVDFNCPQGGSRFCGINHCGEKNEPACLRGIKTLDAEVDGICNNDLNPVLNGDHILVCQ